MNLNTNDLVYLYGQKSLELEVTVNQLNDLRKKLSDPVWLTKQIQEIAKQMKQAELNKQKEIELDKKHKVLLKDVSKDGKTD